MYKDFRKYVIKEQAEEIAKILSDNGINVQIREVKPYVDITFSNPNSLNYWIRLPENQIAKAESILEKELNTSDGLMYHYFSEFTDEELIDVLKSFYDWTKVDYQQARMILKDRGISFTDEELEQFKKISLQEQRAPQKAKTSWIIVGFISALLGGFLGLIIGWNYYMGYKELPNGEIVYLYDSSTRKKGKAMVIIALSVLVLIIAIKLY